MVDRFQCSPCGLAESQIVYPVRLFIRTLEVRASVFSATNVDEIGGDAPRRYDGKQRPKPSSNLGEP